MTTDLFKSIGEWTSCIICGGVESKTWFIQEYKGIEYQIVQCKGCGLVYTNPRYNLEDKSNFYRDPVKTDRGVTVGLRVDAGIKPRIGFRSKYLEFYDGFVGNPTVLDYVCRDGSFLDVLRQSYGWDKLYGLDNRPLLAKIASDNGFRAFNQTIEQADFPEKFFDIIAMRHTLEHLYEPHIALKEVHRVLKDDGYLRIEVPHINSLSRFLSGKRWSGYYIPWHLYYFGRKSLTQLLNQEGFEVVSLTTLPYPHYLLSPMKYLRFLFPKGQSRKVIGKSLDDSVAVGMLLMFPSFVSVWLGMGDELIAVCRKKEGKND